MAETLRGGLSLAHCGFGFWSHDISGFEQTAPAHVYKRWAAFGLLGTHSRLHGSGSYRVPWLFDEESVEVLRHFTKLKCRLMPYLYASAVQAHEKGVPVMRPMMLEFPEDLTAQMLDRQYMLGDSLLVAPVFSRTGEVDYYLPAGEWTCFWDDQQTPGGSLKDGETAEVTVPDLRGDPAAQFHFRREGAALMVRTDSAKPCEVVLHGMPGVGPVLKRCGSLSDMV